MSFLCLKPSAGVAFLLRVEAKVCIYNGLQSPTVFALTKLHLSFLLLLLPSPSLLSSYWPSQHSGLQHIRQDLTLGPLSLSSPINGPLPPQRATWLLPSLHLVKHHLCSKLSLITPYKTAVWSWPPTIDSYHYLRYCFTYLFVMICLTPIEFKFHESRTFLLFCSCLYSSYLQLRLTQSALCIWWMDECI